MATKWQHIIVKNYSQDHPQYVLLIQTILEFESKTNRREWEMPYHPPEYFDTQLMTADQCSSKLGVEGFCFSVSLAF